MIKVCTICKKEYSVPKSRVEKSKYCSYKCMGLGLKSILTNKPRKRVSINCKVCGNLMEVSPCRAKTSATCSNECLTKLRSLYMKERIPRINYNRGDKHHNWKGGVLEENKKERNIFYKEIFPLVIARDDYSCQECGTKNTTLNVHHIKSWAEFPALRFSLDNCITLCAKCHYEITFGREMSEEAKSWGKGKKYFPTLLEVQL